MRLYTTQNLRSLTSNLSEASAIYISHRKGVLREASSFQELEKKKGLFVGYTDSTHIHQVYIPERSSIIHLTRCAVRTYRRRGYSHPSIRRIDQSINQLIAPLPPVEISTSTRAPSSAPIDAHIDQPIDEPNRSTSTAYHGSSYIRLIFEIWSRAIRATHTLLRRTYLRAVQYVNSKIKIKRTTAW